MECKLNITANTSTTHAVVGDILEYKILIKNESENIAENIVVKSLLLQELKFIYKSVKVDYTLDEDLNIISGIEIESLMPGDYAVITFEAEIMKKLSKYIEVEFIFDFNWLIDQDKNLDYCIIKSNKVHINNPGLNLLKKASKKNVQLHDEVEYEIKINNNGDLDLYNILIKDVLPNALELVDGSFMINNIIVNSVDLSRGVTIDKLNINDCVIIKYNTKVISGASGGKLVNKANARYYYTLDNGVKAYKETNEVSSVIKMLISNFKQINMSEYIYMDCQIPSIREINGINANVNIEHFNIIKTPVAISKEGQKLSGYKLIVHGNVEQVMEYISLNEEQSTNSYRFESPFSTYIILPQDFISGTNIEIVGFVEKINSNKINESNFFRSIEMLIIAKTICYR